jgi:hypothetical protein
VLALYSGYGESPDQQKVQTQGKAYLDAKFPKLDSIKSATIVTADAAQPPAGSTPPKP